MRAHPISFATAFATAWLFAACAPALVIDDFSQGPLLIGVYPGSNVSDFSQTNLDPDAVVGGARHWTLLWGHLLNIDPDRQTLAIEATSLSNFFRLTYGSEDTPLGVNLLEDGADRLRFRFLGENTVAFLADVSIVTHNPDTGSFSVASTSVGRRGVAAPTDAIIEIPFDSFFWGAQQEPQYEHIERIVISQSRYLTSWRMEIDSIETAGPPIVGDFDRDGDVDLDDYTQWTGAVGTAQNFRVTTDANGDGYSDAADYTIWRDAYEAALSEAQIPEPSSAVLALLAMVCAARVIRRA